jgi:uncharacterized protein YuzE
MKVQYFDDTDTLYIEFRAGDIAESKDLDGNTILDVDASGNVCAITFEHASKRTDIDRVQLEGISA